MKFGKVGLSGMFAAALLCGGSGQSPADARALCGSGPAGAAAPLCQPAKASRPVEASGRFRVAQVMPLDCYDRCIADFKTCMGDTSTNGPPKTQGPPGSGNGTVATPPPYEFCIGVQDQCIATCKDAAGRKTRF